MQVAGAEVLIERLIDYLGSSIKPSVFCLDEIGAIGERLKASGVPVIVLGRNPGVDWRLPARFADAIIEQKLNILHAHQYTPFFYSSLAKWRCKNRHAFKLIFTEHGRHFPDVVGWKRRMFNRHFLSTLVDKVNACSRFSADAVEKIEGFPRCEVILNGISIDQFPARGAPADQLSLREKLGLPLNDPLVACVARLHPIKDHTTLLKAWIEVLRIHPNAKLLLVGEGEERNNLEAFCKTHGIESSVKFLGVHRNVQDFLRCVDVFALTSLTEASPLTLLEAMSCCCPSVVTNVGGNSEHITDGVEALLAPRGDAIKIAECLNRLLSDRAYRERMGIAAREKVIKDFTIERCFEQYKQLYLTLMQNP
jgi:glycosyltransferase involved in cell wall biosynthesis